MNFPSLTHIGLPARHPARAGPSRTISRALRAIQIKSHYFLQRTRTLVAPPRRTGFVYVYIPTRFILLLKKTQNGRSSSRKLLLSLYSSRAVLITPAYTVVLNKQRISFHSRVCRNLEAVTENARAHSKSTHFFFSICHLTIFLTMGWKLKCVPTSIGVLLIRIQTIHTTGEKIGAVSICRLRVAKPVKKWRRKKCKRVCPKSSPRLSAVRGFIVRPMVWRDELQGTVFAFKFCKRSGLISTRGLCV